MMPVMSGLDFLKKLGKDRLHGGLPVFVLTGKVVTNAESEMLGELLGSILNLEDTQAVVE
jgi:CheY-like chemotaxis protein